MVPNLPSDQNQDPQVWARLHPEVISHERAHHPAAKEAESWARETHSDIAQDPTAKNEGNELSIHQHTRTVPDSKIRGFGELEPPSLSSQSLPTPLPPFPRSPLETLMIKLRDEAELKAKKPREELSAEEKEEKENLEEQCRVKREKENEIWSSCHLFVGGSGIARPGSMEVVDGVKVCGEWGETKTKQESAAPKENITNDCTAVNGFHPLLPTPLPQERLRENRDILLKTHRNPCDSKDHSHSSTLSGRNKIRELEFVDSEEDDEIEREIKSASALSKPDLARARSNQIRYERRKQSRDIDGETLSGITLAESDPLDVIAPSGGVDREKEPLSKRKFENCFKQTDTGPSTTVKKKNYVFEAETDEEDEDEVDGETREDRLQEFVRAMSSRTGGCSRCPVKPPSKNPDIDMTKKNRARLDSIK